MSKPRNSKNLRKVKNPPSIFISPDSSDYIVSYKDISTGKYYAQPKKDYAGEASFDCHKLIEISLLLNMLSKAGNIDDVEQFVYGLARF